MKNKPALTNVAAPAVFVTIASAMIAFGCGARGYVYPEQPDAGGPGAPAPANTSPPPTAAPTAAPTASTAPTAAPTAVPPATPPTAGPTAAPPPAPVPCTTDSDCRVYSGYCGGCNCRALSNAEPDPICTDPAVVCVADPCATRVPLCITGGCRLGDREAGSPPPNCQTRRDGGDTSCKDTKTWTSYGTYTCESLGLSLATVSFDVPCAYGWFRYVTYYCCLMMK